MIEPRERVENSSSVIVVGGKDACGDVKEGLCVPYEEVCSGSSECLESTEGLQRGELEVHFCMLASAIGNKQDFDIRQIQDPLENKQNN